MFNLSRRQKDPRTTSESPPGGISLQIRFSVAAETIIGGFLVLTHAAETVQHFISTIFASPITSILLDNLFPWLSSR